jgi:hypothetical protein
MVAQTQNRLIWKTPDGSEIEIRDDDLIAHARRVLLAAAEPAGEPTEEKPRRGRPAGTRKDAPASAEPLPAAPAAAPWEHEITRKPGPTDGVLGQ